MIRINLLPDAHKSASRGGGASQLWFVGYGVAALATLSAVAFVYMGRSQALFESLARNREFASQIERLEAQSANLAEVQAALERSRQLETVVTDLERARYGPTTLLMELSHLLSRGGSPTIDPQHLEALRRDNPLATYNPAWDTRRLWLSEFREEERTATISGVGKTHDDVAEFLRRLMLSRSFERVELVKTESGEDRETGLPVITFQLTCQVVY